MGLFINANKFSLHATYRNRLIRAYLAASRSTRSPNRFTGFDPADNIKLHELSSEKPIHVLNGALNLDRGEQLAWQERKAESFTMSRLHCGAFRLVTGHRPNMAKRLHSEPQWQFLVPQRIRIWDIIPRRCLVF